MRTRASHYLRREASSLQTVTGVRWTTRDTSLHHRVHLPPSREVAVDIVEGGVLLSLQGGKGRFL